MVAMKTADIGNKLRLIQPIHGNFGGFEAKTCRINARVMAKIINVKYVKSRPIDLSVKSNFGIQITRFPPIKCHGRDVIIEIR
jgi:hypothetical protein